MRKFLFVLATGIAAASFAGCSAKSTTTTEAATSAALETIAAEDVPVGNWTKPESPALTDEIKTYFAEAFPDSSDTFYEPEALLGTQVVSGTNYKILYRKISITSADAVDTYGIGTIYVDLQNKVEVLDAGETGIPTHLDEGGWTVFEVTKLTDDEENAFQAAFNGTTGISCDPIAVIAESDRGYYVLYEATGVYPDAKPYYTAVELKKLTTGGFEIGEINDLATGNIN